MSQRNQREWIVPVGNDVIIRPSRFVSRSSKSKNPQRETRIAIWLDMHAYFSILRAKFAYWYATICNHEKLQDLPLNSPTNAAKHKLNEKIHVLTIKNIN